jgi:hypothetical protein
MFSMTRSRKTAMLAKKRYAMGANVLVTIPGVKGVVTDLMTSHLILIDSSS